MSREEIQRLMGGYATDTLSETERRALFEAALEDQELFNTLAKEQALRDVLRDPLARQQLLDVLEPQRIPAGRRAWQRSRRPAVMALAGAAAILLLVAGLALRRAGTTAHREAIVAQMRTMPPPPAAPLEPAPEPKQLSFAKPQQRAAPRALPAPPHLTPKYAMQENVPWLPPPSSSQSVAGLAGTSGTMLPQAKMVAAASNTGVRYSLLLKGADGEYRPVPLDTVFRSGDSVRLQIVPNNGGYLYLFQRELGGAWRLASSGHVERGQPSLLPSNGAFEYDRPGRKKLLVLLSPQREPSPASLDSAELDALAARAGAGIARAAVSRGNSAYVADTGMRAGQQKVAFEITLEFQ